MKKTTHLLKLFSFSAFWALLLGWVIFAKLPVQATTQSNILVNSSKLDNISAALGQSATGTIAGTVTDMAGHPVANHLVQLYMYVDDPMGLSGWQQVQSVSTDASGIYTFTGNVYLNVGYKVGIHNAYGSSAPYMTEFFDNVGTLDAANLLTPTTGTPLIIANAQLTQGIIMGRVG